MQMYVMDVGLSKLEKFSHFPVPFPGVHCDLHDEPCYCKIEDDPLEGLIRKDMEEERDLFDAESECGKHSGRQYCESFHWSPYSITWYFHRYT